LKETKGAYWNPVGETVWLYPGGKAGLKYKVISSSSRESRLSLVSPSGLRIRKVRVAMRRDTKTGTDWWTETADLGNIGFYFDGESMDIVFTTAVTIQAGQAIHIDLPSDTDIENLDWFGCYQHWGTGTRQHVFLGTAGTYTRGPRLQSDHFSLKAFEFSSNGTPEDKPFGQFNIDMEFISLSRNNSFGGIHDSTLTMATKLFVRGF
jgi:hypothetical protein